MIVETRYHDRFRELREMDLDRAWRRRELVRLARAADASLHARTLATLRAMRRRGSTPDARPAADGASPERSIPWSA